MITMEMMLNENDVDVGVDDDNVYEEMNHQDELVENRISWSRRRWMENLELRQKINLSIFAQLAEDDGEGKAAK